MSEPLKVQSNLGLRKTIQSIVQSFGAGPDLHIVVDSNSQSLPLPWLHKEGHLFPELFTHHWQTYPHVARRALREFGEVEVSIFGARGGTVSAMVARRLEVMNWMDDDVLVINHGIVDCWPRKRGQKCPAAEFERILGEGLAFARSQRPNRLIVLLGISLSDANMHAKIPQLEGMILEHDAIVRKQVEASGSVFLDVQSLQKASQEPFMHPDGHHFSRHGHQLIGEELARIVKRHLGPAPTRMARWWREVRRRGA